LNPRRAARLSDKVLESDKPRCSRLNFVFHTRCNATIVTGNFHSQPRSRNVPVTKIIREKVASLTSMGIESKAAPAGVSFKWRNK